VEYTELRYREEAEERLRKHQQNLVQEIKEAIKGLTSILWWIALWLFIIACNSWHTK
jgi:hypothetical protein